MARENPNSALEYHEETKHSELSVRMSMRRLDWANRPAPFKVYKDAPSIPLPCDFPRPHGRALRAIVGADKEAPRRHPDLGLLAEILFFSAGLTRKMGKGENTYYMRAAPATGALYPIELYVVCVEVPGLGAGIYHFNPLDFALMKLREGDYRAELGSAGCSDCLGSPVTIILTSLAWRNAWKYEARSYRHWFWDSGVIAANLLATCSSEGLPVKLLLGFVDSEIDALLGLEKGKEATVAVAAVGAGSASTTPRKMREGIRSIPFASEPVSREEVEYPIVWKTNGASALANSEDVKAWRESFKPQNREAPHGRPAPALSPAGEADQSPPALGEVILRRGSTRKFARRSISFEQASRIITASSGNVPLDLLPAGETLLDLYFVANDVQGLQPGSYFFDRGKASLEQLKEGQFRSMTSYLCLDQPLFGDASAVFFLMADLDRVTGSLSNRGYRAAQFEAGVRAGKIYLSSYALGMGASGSTFYDDAVTEFLSPHAKGKSTMMAVGVGVPTYKVRQGTVLPQSGAFSKGAT
jgi:SagB-type dehydrogenase family enzyme